MMLVDCQTCPVRDVHCADCMVTALTTIPLRPGRADREHERAHRRDPDDAPDRPLERPLDRAERRAVSAFLGAGLVTTATANAARAVLDEGVAAPHVRHAV
ncbi:hypothetical protein [Terrabacter aeriphilus]